ncbi:large proline-rich protein BAG6-like [Ixodes scapularis]
MTHRGLPQMKCREAHRTGQAPGRLDPSGPVDQTLGAAAQGGVNTGDGRTAERASAARAPQVPRARQPAGLRGTGQGRPQQHRGTRQGRPRRSPRTTERVRLRPGDLPGPAAPRVLGAPDTCWLCGVPIIHLETHEAGRLHADLLEAQPLPDHVAAAVQTLRASRPDLLAPAALASVQPARPPENRATAPAAAAAAIEPATTTAPTTPAATTSCGPSHRASVVYQPPPSPSTSDDAIMAEVEQLLGQNQ